ncbi:hypothetical protein VC83_02593 [Pseudogymnoascus destructans]|uniref:Uncharacterized protein n=1 Tax=Pseudogymnoascus destructans TaxID=655981 RepID=A0A177AF79_9PEZI|nr:uncharacterized protein VC83_02593 [Pseudogymnoascus destructans]OAF60779.1 hypothetical protein VC83_02593 [Pseudogymnoascus destructans]
MVDSCEKRKFVGEREGDGDRELQGYRPEQQINREWRILEDMENMENMDTVVPKVSQVSTFAPQRKKHRIRRPFELLHNKAGHPRVPPVRSKVDNRRAITRVIIWGFQGTTVCTLLSLSASLSYLAEKGKYEANRSSQPFIILPH